MLVLFIFVLLISQISAQLSFCDEENKTAGIRLCHIPDNYDKSFPPNPQPMHLELTMNVIDIVEFNQDARTVTLFLQVLTIWNDTRLTLKSNDPSE